jgi:hypothetical protein
VVLDYAGLVTETKLPRAPQGWLQVWGCPELRRVSCRDEVEVWLLRGCCRNGVVSRWPRAACGVGQRQSCLGLPRVGCGDRAVLGRLRLVVGVLGRSGACGVGVILDRLGLVVGS